jgi:Sulphur transport
MSFSIFAIGIAMLLAAVMGFAIQRGATCTVAAVEEWVERRRVTRLVSMIEASIIVAAGLVIAHAAGLVDKAPAGYPVSAWVVMGGVLLGIGAYINQACVFGAIARLGSGEWSYLATPIGFYAGCKSIGYVLPYIRGMSPAPLSYASPVFQMSAAFAVIALSVMLVRLLWPIFFSHSGSHPKAQRIWSPHVATAVIGVTFLFLLLMMGAWAYTDVLAELARGMSRNLVTRSLLLLALFSGALIGGWTAGRFASRRFSVKQLAKCFLGGALMGWGSLMIPGSNDGLILLGMPLLWPYAWIAFTTMCVSIGVAMVLRKGWLSRWAAMSQ